MSGSMKMNGRIIGILLTVLLPTATGAAADTPVVGMLRPDSHALDRRLGLGSSLSGQISCVSLAPTPPPDTAQLVALDRYLFWREVVPESARPRLSRAAQRVLVYVIDGARRPGILHTGIDLIWVEVIQFPDEETAKEFDPLTQTELGIDPVDLNGPGELERHITYRTRTVRNGNLILFIDLGGEAAAAEEVASIRRACDRLVAAFTEEWSWYDVEARQAERQLLHEEWQAALALLTERRLPDPGGLAGAPAMQQDELRRQLQAALAACRSHIPRLEAALDALNADEPWLVPTSVCGMDAVRLLAARADSPAFLPDRRTIEFAAIDALFAVPPEELTDSEPELPAITAMLRESAKAGLLEEQCRLLGLHWPLRVSGLRVYGNLAGVTLMASEEEDAQAAAGTRPWRWGGSRDSRMPTLQPGWALALYLRKTDAGWVIRQGIPRHEAPWQ